MYHGWLCLVAIAAAANAHPRLAFGPDDLPALRRRIESDAQRERWRRILARAERLIDPASADFADPELIDAGQSDRPAVLAHQFGRRLTDWMETLGFAYQITGDGRYAAHGARILAVASERLVLTDERIGKSFAGARGDIMRGFAVGCDWLGETLDQALLAKLGAVAADYIDNILTEAGAERTWWVPHHNFIGVAVSAAGLLAVATHEQHPARTATWLDACAGWVSTWLDEGFDADGAYYEGVGYSGYGLDNAVFFATALQRFGGRDLLDHPHLRQYPRFLAQSLLPGEAVYDARNDSNYAGLATPTLARLAAAWNDGLARWLWDRAGGGDSPLAIVWDNDVPPAPPTTLASPDSDLFAGRGLAVFRTGWAREDVMLSVEAGPYRPVTHNQADKGSFTLYGLGERWAIDSGYGNNRQPGGRDQSEAHNVVLVDGRGQAISGAGAGTSGRIAGYAADPDHGWVLADALEAYQRNNHNQTGVPLVRALRHALFVRPSHGAPAYAVVLDDLAYDGLPHDWAWQLHTTGRIAPRVTEGRVVLAVRGASGGAYLETPAESTERGRAEWRFEVAEAGDYVVWASVRAVGAEAAKSDSFVVGLDDGAPVQWHMPGSRDWQWGRVADGVPAREVTFRLTAGEHTLWFETREPGAQVDALVVTRDHALQPSAGAEPGPGTAVLEAENASLRAPMRVVGDEDAAGATLMLWLNAAAPVSFGVDAYDGHPRITGRVTAVEPEFAALLVPLPHGTAEPRVDIQRGKDGLILDLRWPGRHDQIAWSAASGARPAVRLEPTG